MHCALSAVVGGIDADQCLPAGWFIFHLETGWSSAWRNVMNKQHWQDWLTTLVGAWLIVSPYFLSFVLPKGRLAEACGLELHRQRTCGSPARHRRAGFLSLLGRMGEYGRRPVACRF